jgi:hypothetical protein
MRIDHYYVEHPHARRTYASVDEVAIALLTRGIGLIGGLDYRGGERTLTDPELQHLGRAIGETRRRIRKAAARALLTRRRVSSRLRATQARPPSESSFGRGRASSNAPGAHSDGSRPRGHSPQMRRTDDRIGAGPAPASGQM